MASFKFFRIGSLALVLVTFIFGSNKDQPDLLHDLVLYNAVPLGLLALSFFALKGEDLTIYGSGEQTRCFGHVLDIVDAILKIENTSEAIACPVNIGVSEEISILNLASSVLRLLNSKSTVKFVPYEEVYSFGFEDMQRRVPDNALLKKLTVWQPKRGIEQIVLDIASHINK